jgi:hypothetical protein
VNWVRQRLLVQALRRSGEYPTFAIRFGCATKRRVKPADLVTSRGAETIATGVGATPRPSGLCVSVEAENAKHGSYQELPNISSARLLMKQNNEDVMCTEMAFDRTHVSAESERRAYPPRQTPRHVVGRCQARSRLGTRGLLIALVAGTSLVPLVAKAATVSFGQVDWLDNAGGYTAQNSEWGQFSIELTSSDDSLFFNDSGSGRYGYLNVVTSIGVSSSLWSIQNLTLCYETASHLDSRLPESVSFNLGTARGLGLSSLDSYWTITSSPLSAQPSGTMTTYSVGSVSWLFGGIDDALPLNGNSGNAPPPMAQAYVGASVSSVSRVSGAITSGEKQVPAVNEDTSGCAPGAAARSLKYLEAEGKISLGGKNVQEVYDEIKNSNYMDTKLTPKGGTTVDNFFKGKNEYSKDNDLSLRTYGTFDPIAAANALKSGADVEMGVWWGTSGGANLGGHAAFVTEIVVDKDASGNVTGYKVKYLDDAQQGDGTAANNSHDLSFDANGNLKNAPGNGAKLIRFFVEIPEPNSALIFTCFIATFIFIARRRGGFAIGG